MSEFDLIFLIITGLFAGFVDAIAGGGGLITIPALLTTGLPPHTVLGTNKMAATMGIINASRTYIKHNIFQPRYWLAALTAVFFGALFGTLATQLFSSESFEKLLPIILLIVAIYILIPKSIPMNQQPSDYRPKHLSSITTGSLLGFYDGFFGPGTGAFWTAILMRLYKMEMLQATAIAKLMNAMSNAVAMITFMLLSHVNYRLGLVMGVAIMLGSYVGARCALRYGVRFIKAIFLSVVFALIFHLIWTQWLH